MTKAAAIAARPTQCAGVTMASQALAKVSHDMWVYGITVYCPFSETHTHTLEHKMITKMIGRELNPLMQTTRQDYVHDMQ